MPWENECQTKIGENKMNAMKQTKPGKTIKINGKTFIAFATNKCSCFDCDMKDYEKSGFCKKVECRPTFREDNKRVHFRELL